MSRPLFYDSVTACDECDSLHRIPPLKSGERFKCARCGHVLINVHAYVKGRIFSAGCSSLFMLVFALIFPFLGFSSNGAERSITLFTVVSVLINQDYLLLSAVISLALFVFPVAYLLAVVLLVWSFRHRYIRRSIMRYLIRWVIAIQPWLMVDVFLVGILVALVKMDSLADIELGLSFWAFCAYVLLLLKTVSLVDRRWLWNQIEGQGPDYLLIERTDSDVFESAQQHGLIGCHFCGATLHHSARHCSRCGHSIHSRRPHSLTGTIAFLIASVIMFVPANVFPIMQTTFLGGSEPSTIMGGVLLLWSLESYPVALVIFMASVVIPLVKILSLSWLCWQCYYPTERKTLQKIRLYRITELVGRWSMIDIFVVAVLTGLVQMGELMSILPGPAVLSFMSVIILTMLAAMTFDPRLLWDSNRDSVSTPRQEKKE
ncbi:paraquat-inducible protein A [Marinomonas profundimaris]|uniref:Paraquat-inducible protein A n=1 Tax=Marinomonas profundimaris TaxID=1208321 RepID=W1RYX6_9GAMM|nr:paraquat-inducible protein A [Marinomonas profundimaris]ETI62391.1 paraquat-inducible protein A [Marinomonas profundimaris]